MVRGGWTTAPLGELCRISIGKTPSRNEPRYWGDGFPWLSIADMNQGKNLFETTETITADAVRECRCQLVQEGTLLMSFKLSIGKLGFARIPMFTNEAIASLPVRNPQKLISEYLYFALMSADLLSGTDRAVMGQTLNTRKLHEIPIPLPALPEQKRIAGILARADRLRQLRRYALQLSDNFLQSVFLQMFGDHESTCWPNVKVEVLAKGGRNTIRTGPFGSSLLHSEFSDDPSGVMVFGIDNAVNNRFELGRPRYITRQKYSQLKRYTVYPGDVLITIMGTCGRCAIVPDGIPLAINTKHLFCISLDVSRCLPTFLHSAFLYDPLVLLQLGVSERGAIMAGLNAEIIRSLKLTLPPIGLQRTHQSIVQKYDGLRSQQREALRQADHLFDALLHRAFRGEL